MSTIFFQWFTQTDNITTYKNNLIQNIFSCIEMLSMDYFSVMNMPIKRFYDLLKWKSDLEEERQKQLEQEQGRYR